MTSRTDWVRWSGWEWQRTLIISFLSRIERAMDRYSRADAWWRSVNWDSRVVSCRIAVTIDIDCFSDWWRALSWSLRGFEAYSLRTLSCSLPGLARSRSILEARDSKSLMSQWRTVEMMLDVSVKG